MGLFSSSGPLQPQPHNTKSVTPRDVASPEYAQFVTNPLAAGAPRSGTTPCGLTNPCVTAVGSSKQLSPDAPTPAVPLAALLEEAQNDALWGRGDVERKTAAEAVNQELTLYRLAIDANNLNYEQAYTILALTVEFFHKGEHVERVEQQALRTAAGVLLRVQTQLQEDPLRILAPFYLGQLRNIFQAWHLYRELVKAIDNRSDFLVRMRGKTDRLIIDSLFSEEGRSMLAARVDGFIQACARLQLDSEPLKRAEWIGKLLMYRTEDTNWQVPPDACIGLCTRLLREAHDDAVMGALRRLAVASWEGLCKETNYLRDIFTDATAEEMAQGVVLIRTAVPIVGLPVHEEEEVLYFPDHNSFREHDRREREKDRQLRLVI